MPIVSRFECYVESHCVRCDESEPMCLRLPPAAWIPATSGFCRRLASPRVLQVFITRSFSKTTATAQPASKLTTTPIHPAARIDTFDSMDKISTTARLSKLRQLMKERNVHIYSKAPMSIINQVLTTERYSCTIRGQSLFRVHCCLRRQAALHLRLHWLCRCRRRHHGHCHPVDRWSIHHPGQQTTR